MINKTEHWETDKALEALYEKLIKVEPESEAVTTVNRLVELIPDAAGEIHFNARAAEEA